MGLQDGIGVLGGMEGVGLMGGQQEGDGGLSLSMYGEGWARGRVWHSQRRGWRGWT